nr:AlNc14C193G8514 [Albugo laibachii Nc14]|eukprot:CCA23439.1 AlNc14C193G8514 [Albugo laibachii Nc14]
MIQAYSQSERSPVNLLGADAFEIEHTAFPRKWMNISIMWKLRLGLQLHRYHLSKENTRQHCKA